MVWIDGLPAAVVGQLNWVEMLVGQQSLSACTTMNRTNWNRWILPNRLEEYIQMGIYKRWVPMSEVSFGLVKNSNRAPK